MAHRSLLPEAVDDYLRTVVARETPLQQRLRAETSRLPMGGMQIGADQGVLLAFLVRLIGARNAIEVGTFTGYSALAVASALPAGRTPRLLRRERGVDRDRAPLLGRGRRRRPDRAAPAAGAGDARGAAARERRRRVRFRVHRCRQDRLRRATTRPASRCCAPGGLIAIDNVLWSGTVADPADQKPDTVALRSHHRQDPRRFARRRVPRSASATACCSRASSERSATLTRG